MTVPISPPHSIPKTNTLAIVAFIAAFMIPVAGIVLGVVARRDISRTGEGGSGLARAAIALGSIFTALYVLFFIVWLALFATAFSQGFSPAG